MLGLMLLLIPLELAAKTRDTSRFMRTELEPEGRLTQVDSADWFFNGGSSENKPSKASVARDCIASDTAWQRANSTATPGVIFYDLGVEAGQSTLMMLGQTVEDSCEYAADTRIAGGRDVCTAQNQKVKNILEAVQEKAQASGLDIFKDQKIVMVEAGPQYVPVIKQIQARFPHAIQVFVPFAISAGHDDQNATGLVYDVRQKTIMPGMVAQANQSEDVKINPLNLMRLLINTARRDDFVVLKMDIEGAEFDVVPCLVNSPAAELIDVFLLERHDQFAGATPKELTRAMQTLQDKGIMIREDWP